MTPEHSPDYKNLSPTELLKKITTLAERLTHLKVKNQDRVRVDEYRQKLEKELQPKDLLTSILDFLIDDLSTKKVQQDLQTAETFYLDFNTPDEAKIKTLEVSETFTREWEEFSQKSIYNNQNPPYFLKNRNLEDCPPGIIMLTEMRSLRSLLFPEHSETHPEKEDSPVWAPGREQTVAPGRELTYPPGRRPR